MRQMLSLVHKSCRRLNCWIAVLLILIALLAAGQTVYGVRTLMLPSSAYEGAAFLSNARWIIRPIDGFHLSDRIDPNNVSGKFVIIDARLIHQANIWGDFMILLLIGAALWYLHRFLHTALTAHSPFVCKSAGYIKMTAVFILLASIVPHMFKKLLMWQGSLGERSFFYNEQIIGLIAMLLSGCILLVISKMFAYGCALQLEQDETL